MNFDRLRELILERAIQGKLVPQLESEPLASQITCKSENLPFKIPEKWGSAYLADLIEFLDYGTSTKCHATKEVQDVPVLRMCNIDNGIVNLENLKYANRDLIELPRPYLQYGDLVFNRTNSLELVGKCAPFLRDEKYSFASYLIRVRPKPMINTKYLSYWINSNICRRTQIHPKVSKQVGQANFSGSKLKQIVVPLPPIEEQLRIVFKIDDLFAKIKLLENSYRELQKLKEALRKLILQKAVQGKIVPQLESELTSLVEGEIPEILPFQIPEKWHWIRIKTLEVKRKTVEPASITDEKVELWSIPAYDKGEAEVLSPSVIGSNKKVVFKGDVLLSKIVPHIERVWVVTENESSDPLIKLASTEWLTYKSDLFLPDFLALLFKSPYFRENMLKRISGMGSLKRANPRLLSEILLPLPPKEEQQRILKKVDSLIDRIGD